MIDPGCDTKSGSEAQFQSRFDPVSESRKQLETCSNVVSSTMEDEDSSSREGLTPLTTVKVRIFYVFCTKPQVDNPQSVPFFANFVSFIFSPFGFLVFWSL